MRVHKRGEIVLRKIAAKRKNQASVEIEEVRVSVADPTLMGGVWEAPPASYIIHRLATGEDVSLNGDGTAMIVDSGERLTLC